MRRHDIRGPTPRGLADSGGAVTGLNSALAQTMEF